MRRVREDGRGDDANEVVREVVRRVEAAVCQVRGRFCFFLRVRRDTRGVRRAPEIFSQTITWRLV